MDLIFRLVNYSAANDGFRWNLDKFTDNPKLDYIDTNLRIFITECQRVNSTDISPTISIIDVHSLNDIEISCSCGIVHTDEDQCVVCNTISWNAKQLTMFLDYINNHDIAYC